MCGIVGFVKSEYRRPEEDFGAMLTAMAGAIVHRGPDDQGIWFDASAGVGLGHRRLSIVDLSPGGHQPMVSRDRRFVIVFNGEIYNHIELRAELETLGRCFNSSSDTEVLLEGIAQWGVVPTCERLLGMFAFGVWDRETRRLFLARDRLGKKPIYLYQDRKGGVAFASEIKALWHYSEFAPSIDAKGLAEYLRYSYVADHVSIFRDVEKVMPGTVIEIGAGNARQTHLYWSLADVAERGSLSRITDLAEAEESLLSLLQDATRRRMLADVPLGAFLSGGIDSGLVVSLMQEASAKKVRTFSIGFSEAGFNEAPVAKAVARHLGTDHTELYVSDADAQRVVTALPDMFDEPFADASQIPTYLLAKLTRDQVTVALTGDGGDESFGGYLRYRNQEGLVGRLSRLPRPLRHALASGAVGVPARVWEALMSLVPARNRPRLIASKVAKVARAMQLDTASERTKAYLSFWSPQEVLLDQDFIVGDPFEAPEFISLAPSESMQFWETGHYLSGDLLAKLDRATMAASLEARSPLLDHRVVELAWRLPSNMKASKQGSKRILRNLLFRYVPAELVDLPKQGFSVPIGKWMSTGMRDWVESMLAYGRANTAGLFDWTAIDFAWRCHLTGRVGFVEKLWIVVMFCSWHQRWLASSSGRTGHG